MRYCILLQDKDRLTLVITERETDAQEMARKYDIGYWKEETNRTAEEIMREVEANL